MRYLVQMSVVHVVGRIWQPGIGPCAMTYTLNSYDVENATDDNGKITRDSVQNWLDTNAGDFAEIIDWSASIESNSVEGGTVELAWSDEESELTFYDCMYDNDES